MATKRKTTPKTPLPREVPLKYVVPDDMSVVFSDGVTIQHTENEFILSFFQNSSPVFVTDAQRSAVKEVESRCVARIVMTPAQMAKNLEAFQTNFEVWASRPKLVVEAKK